MRPFSGIDRGELDDLGLEIPGWGRVASEASMLWAKLTGWGKNLKSSRQDIQAMKTALERYPRQLAERRAAILALEAKQQQLDSRYISTRAGIKKVLDYIKSWVPGMSDLGFAPLVIPITGAIAALTAAAVLGAAIMSHFKNVGVEKALIARLSPEAAKEVLETRKAGFLGGAKNMIMLGIAAVILLPLLTRK